MTSVLWTSCSPHWRRTPKKDISQILTQNKPWKKVLGIPGKWLKSNPRSGFLVWRAAGTYFRRHFWATFLESTKTSFRVSFDSDIFPRDLGPFARARRTTLVSPCLVWRQRKPVACALHQASHYQSRQHAQATQNRPCTSLQPMYTFRNSNPC